MPKPTTNRPRLQFEPVSEEDLAALHWGRGPVETTCVSCARGYAATRYPYLYCSEACKQTAHLVRWTRRKIAENTFERDDIRVAYEVKLGHILAGGYPEKARRVPAETRALVLDRGMLPVLRPSVRRRLAPAARDY